MVDPLALGLVGQSHPTRKILSVTERFWTWHSVESSANKEKHVASQFPAHPVVLERIGAP